MGGTERPLHWVFGLQEAGDPMVGLESPAGFLYFTSL